MDRSFLQLKWVRGEVNTQIREGNRKENRLKTHLVNTQLQEKLGAFFVRTLTTEISWQVGAQGSQQTGCIPGGSSSLLCTQTN